MGIMNFRIEEIDSSSAKARWNTDMDATTELSIGKIQPDGSCTMTDKPAVGSPGMSHEYPVSGLDAGSTYRAEAKSYDEGMGDYMPCDDGSSPKEFTTEAPAPAVPAGITLTASAARVSPGCDVEITAKALDTSGAALSGVAVDFSVKRVMGWLFFWLPSIGSVNPASATTDASGEAKTTFTAAKKGLAVIKGVSGSLKAYTSVKVY